MSKRGGRYTNGGKSRSYRRKKKQLKIKIIIPKCEVCGRYMKSSNRTVDNLAIYTCDHKIKEEK